MQRNSSTQFWVSCQLQASATTSIYLTLRIVCTQQNRNVCGSQANKISVKEKKITAEIFLVSLVDDNSESKCIDAHFFLFAFFFKHFFNLLQLEVNCQVCLDSEKAYRSFSRVHNYLTYSKIDILLDMSDTQSRDNFANLLKSTEAIEIGQYS